MPIADINDAHEVDEHLNRILAASDNAGSATAIRSMFVETLDWDYAHGIASLHGANDDALPRDARLLARREGCIAAYMPLHSGDNPPVTPTNRITAATVNAAARALSADLGEDLLLLFTNAGGSEFHIIRPGFTGSRLTLQRMVARRGEHHRTVVQQLANMWHDYGRSGKSVYEAIVRAFSVEPVTQEFFREYRRVFEDAKSAITGFAHERELHLFTQTLFNRLMFVYFISRKGWLRFNGNADYLNALWEAYLADDSQSNFYTARLKPLFFAGLNNPQSRNLSMNNPVLYETIGEVPFLNGGLFEKNELDARDDSILLEDAVIARIFAALFNRFNFTVTESTPYDVEVAIDPEMLGKVFEELVNERHESGAYYTPRPVVSFMCRESLKGFLSGQTGAIAATGLTDAAIADFVDARDTDGVSVADARKIAAALERVTVVDPACGSGAYLLGMMQELADLQTTLFNAGVDSKAIYDLKLEIIRRNLYGADIDDFAVNIAMLRLWLSLAIDYEGNDPSPLPNLDFKIACGDSLLAPDPSPQNYGDLFGDFIRQFDLGSLISKHMRATEQPGKDRLKAEIEHARQQIREMLGDAAVGASGSSPAVIDWRVEFAEVMSDGGFDIVIANPPYGITINGRRSSVIGNTDSYTNFMALASEIAPNGIMSYITPTSWETGARFKKFRQFLFDKMAIQSVVNLPYDVFDSPYVDTAITTGNIGQPPYDAFQLATLEKRAELDLTGISDYIAPLEWSVVMADTELRIPLIGWAATLFSRIMSRATPLGDVTSSKRGIAQYRFDILKSQLQDALPFFEGQVQRYEVSGASAHNFVVVSEREASFHQGLRILSRRLVSRSNRLSFARTSKTFVVKEAILPIKPKFDNPQKLATLLAILNSSLMSFLYITRSTAATKDDFRQVTLAGLRELPVIFPDSDTTEELAELVSEREHQKGNVEELERKIDAIVYKVYGVTDDEQADIAAWLARSG